MIYESWYWKKELLDLQSQFRTWAIPPAGNWDNEEWLGNSNFQLERSVFYSALIIRRLIESKKITHKLEGLSLSLQTFNSYIKGPTNLSHSRGTDHLFSHFKMADPTSMNFSPHTIASEIIHSYTLTFYKSELASQFGVFFVASEKNNYKRLVDVPYETWSQLVDKFSKNEVTKQTIKWDENRKKTVETRE